MKETIWVVDDDKMNLQMASDILKDSYSIFTLDSGEELFIELRNIIPDLILLDLVMPGMSGLEVMTSLKKNDKYKDIPVVFLTAAQSAEVETECLQAGAEDFVTKPFVPAVLISRVERIIALKQYQNNLEDMVQKQAEQLVKKERELNRTQKEMLKQTQELNRAQGEALHHARELNNFQREVINSMANLIESRDNSTGNHVKRTGIYVERMINLLKKDGTYREELTDSFVENLLKAAPMHDIGKIKIPDHILQKPGKLTAEEFEVIKTHATEGGKIVRQVLGGVESPDFLAMAMDVATFHHEKWDGSGYPSGLSGKKIPLSARIMAVADVFDALVSKRCYKDSMSPEEAFTIIENTAGSHFDPDIAGGVLKHKEEFVEGMIEE